MIPFFIRTAVFMVVFGFAFAAYSDHPAGAQLLAILWDFAKDIKLAFFNAGSAFFDMVRG